MSERILRVRIRTVGQESVTRAVRGITQGARAAQRAQQTADRTVTREAQRSARTREALVQREARERARIAQQLARELSRIEAQSAREEQRSANDVFRMRMRLHQQRIRAERRADQERQRFQSRMNAGAAGFAAVGVVGAISAISSTLDSITSRIAGIAASIGSRAGAQDVGQRTASAQDFEEQMSQSAGQFFQDVSPEERATQMAQLTEEINRVAAATAQSPNDLLNVLATMQENFSAFEYGRANLEAIAEEAERTGGDIQSLATFVGTLNQALGETAPSAERAFAIMDEGGLQGAITPTSFAENFAPLLNQFQSQTGLQGEDALRQFMGLANVIRTESGSDAEAATNLGQLMTSMGSQETRARIAERTGGRRRGHGRSAVAIGGAQYLNADGTIDYARLIPALATIPHVGDTNQVFGESGARLAVDSIVRAETGVTENPTVAELAAVDADHAARRRKEDLARHRQTTAYQSRQIAVQGQIEGIQQLGGRAKQGNALNAYNEALTQTGMDAYLGEQSALGRWAPSWITQMAMPALSGQLSQLSGDQRAGITHWSTALLGAQGLDLGNAVNAVAGVGDRASAIQKQSLGGAVRLQEGSRVGLDDPSVARLATAIGREVAAQVGPTPPPASSPTETPTARRIPRDRR